MTQISKCPKVSVVLTYWEALGDVSGLSYKSLLYFSSNGSYCNTWPPSISHLHTRNIRVEADTPNIIYY